MQIRDDTETEFDARVLMSLVVDLVELEASTGRVRIQVRALAKEHGIALPQSTSPSR
jgi:hypothetical protein